MSFGDERDRDAPDELPLEGWPTFRDALHARLIAGRRAYGARSFERPPAELLAELEQELLDVCGWTYVLFQRIERLRRRVAAAEGSP